MDASPFFVSSCRAVGKRPLWAVQKTVFCVSEDGWSACGKPSFTRRKTVVCSPDDAEACSMLVTLTRRY